MLQIYNSLTRQKERFEPIEPGKVRMYVCGMTVYDYCHIGHARVMVVFDVVARYLRSRGLAVTYVRNITDIDDKIIKRAAERGESIGQLTEFFIRAMHEDAAALGVLPPDQEPHATASIGEIVGMIGALMRKGYAYRGDNGDIYYRVGRFSGYGRLSGKRLEDLRAGERVEVNEAKEDPLDFVLWKAAKPGEPQWPSPWGPGRPGWHIECSAMSTHCLGDHFDIHGGGMDLMFPHHENEIAQSEAATGHKFVNYWMHNGFVQVNEEKMSKSLGNFFTVRDVLKMFPDIKAGGEVIRYFILSSHYRGPLSFSDQVLVGARTELQKFYIALKDIEPDEKADGGVYDERFVQAMDDDFNTHEALRVLFDLRSQINSVKAQDRIEAGRLAGVMKRLGRTMGIFEVDNFLQKCSMNFDVIFRESMPVSDTFSSVMSNEAIDSLIAKRTEARRNMNWAESDRIRDELDKQGIILEDGPQRTTWRRK